MYKLPNTLRSRLREPLGKIVNDAELEKELKPPVPCLIVVGDESAVTLKRHNYNPKLVIVDFHTQRRNGRDYTREVRTIGDKVIKVENPAGVITDELWSAIEHGLRDAAPVRIEVTGEEDLAFIPCMLMAPDNAVVVYGYPGRGLVLARVNPRNRQAAKDALEAMIKEG